MSLQKFFDSMEDYCGPREGRVADFQWEAKGKGFGGFYFYIGKEDGEVHCENECMSREFIKEMLCYMVDNAIMDDEKD